MGSDTPDDWLRHFEMFEARSSMQFEETVRRLERLQELASLVVQLQERVAIQGRDTDKAHSRLDEFIKLQTAAYGTLRADVESSHNALRNSVQAHKEQVDAHLNREAGARRFVGWSLIVAQLLVVGIATVAYDGFKVALASNRDQEHRILLLEQRTSGSK